jgi:hypothetical protein
MRAPLALILTGVGLMALGAGWGWYYTAVAYPEQRTTFENHCRGPPAVPCPAFAPPSQQPLFGLAGLLSGLGFRSLLVGWIRWAADRSKKRVAGAPERPPSTRGRTVDLS